MAYPEQVDTLPDIVTRKEYWQYHLDHRIYKSQILKASLERFEEENVHLELSSYQALVSNFLDPRTPNARLLLKWDPGMGKTIAAIDVAMRYIHLFESTADYENPENIGYVTIVGFTEEIFKKELISYPKYGFVTHEEIKQLHKLRDTINTKIDIERYQEFKAKLHRRLTSRQDRGYFRFFGYKAFVNRIFMLENSSRDINEMTEDEIRTALRDGSLKWNEPLLQSFKNSLLICDEVHNVYNSVEKNNWGVALQMVLDYHPSLKALFMSATPINNNPSEIVDLINLMSKPTDRIVKSDLFTPDNALKKDSLKIIAEKVRGKISFIQDSNPRDFASQTIYGEEIPGIPYLKFTRCPMTDFHYKTYKKVYTGTLTQDAQYLVDIAFPNPVTPEVGLYKTMDIKKNLSFADEDWVQKGHFRYSDGIITGPGFDNIHMWSAKMATLLKHIKGLLNQDSGKLFIYHNVVHITGVLFIEQLLQHAGFLSIDQSETPNTLCVICGKEKKVHKNSHTESKTLGGVAGSNVTSDTTKPSGSSEIRKITNYIQAKKLEAKVFDFDEPRRTDFSKWTYGYYSDNDELMGLIELQQGPLRITSIVVSERRKGIGSKLVNYVLNLPPMPNGDDSIEVTIPNGCDDSVAEFWTALKFKVTHQDSEDIRLTRQLTRGGYASIPHTFMPARYVTAHSDMDKSAMQRNIDRFNSNDNTYGQMVKVLIGSKIVRESYNFRAVRHEYIVGRPDNISSLMQILGRSRRKRAHTSLPPKLRTIEVRIFTSALPVKDPRGNYQLSHEETKYKEKVQDYLIIQKIEKVMHEQAIDSNTARSIIDPGLDKKTDTLGPLYFVPEQKIPKRITIDDLKLATFEAFHGQSEIKMLIYLIKRMFIELSCIFTFDELWKHVRNPPLHTEINTELFQIDYFVIALSSLVINIDGGKTIVNTHGVMDIRMSLMDILHNSTDKRIQLPDGSIGFIYNIGKYYMFIPIDPSGNPRDPLTEIMAVHVEAPFRVPYRIHNRPINVLRYVKETNTLANYENRKLRFKSKYGNVPIERLTTTIGKFGMQFHTQFVEEIIKYVFSVWTDPGMTEKSEHHDFYFKMLYFYDLMGLIVWMSTAKESVAKDYSNYIIELKGPERNVLSKMSGEILKMSKEELNKSLQLSEDYIVGRKKKKKIVKVNPNMLPIGHFMSTVPRFYHPDKDWYPIPDYTQRTQEYKENDIIIGYYEKSPTGLRIKFKIRTPVQYIQKYNDARMIEKGSICSSNSKTYLIEIATKLGIKFGNKINLSDLCSQIESNLIFRELNERRKKTNIKWFYSFWETRPDERKPGITSSISSSSSS